MTIEPRQEDDREPIQPSFVYKPRRDRLVVIALAVVLVAAIGGMYWWVQSDQANKMEGLVHWHTNYAAAQRRAKATGSPMLIDFFATWCGPCQLLARQVYNNASRAKGINQHFVCVTVNMSGYTVPPLAQRFAVAHIPTLIVTTPAGKEVGRITGYMGAQTTTQWLQRAWAKAHNAGKYG